MAIAAATINRFRILTACALLAAASATASAQDVVWTDLVNASVSGTTLQKTGGCNGCGDAGARSQQAIAAGDGYVEFTVGEANTFWFAGLSHGNDDTTYTDIDFSFRFNGAGSADVMENGIYRGGDTSYAAGDVFRVAVVNGRVEYRRNGTLLYTSQIAPAYPLLLDTALGSVGAAFSVLLVAPLAMSGGVLGLGAAHIPLSVSAAVGFIALLGQVCLASLLVVSAVEQRRRSGENLLPALAAGAASRFRTVLMTALLAILGLMPAALSSGVGSETQRPFAVVITTGLVTAVAVTLFVLPFAYALVVGKPPTTAIESEIEM